MAFTQSENTKLGLNPTLQNNCVTGETYHFQEWGNQRIYFGTGSPSGEVSAYPGNVAITDQGIFTCNGDGAGGKGTQWVSATTEPNTATAVGGTEATVTHGLGYVPSIWFVNDDGEFADIEVTAVTVNSFKYYSTEAGTVYYR